MMRKPKIGLLLLATERFRNLGSDTEEGSYEVRKLHEAEEIRSRLETAGDIIGSGPVYTREELAESMSQFQTQKADCIIAFYMSWTEDFLWVRFLRDMSPVPILFVSMVREEIKFQDTWKETDFVEFLSDGGLVGSLEGSGSVQRFHRPMLEVFLGSMDEIVKKAESFSKASCLRSILFQSVFGLLASFNEVMWTTYVDPYLLFQKAGPELRFLSVATLAQETAKVSRARVEECYQILSTRYPVTPDVEKEKFYASIQASLALENMAVSNHLDLLVLNDVDPVLLTEIGLRPGFIPSPSGPDIPVVPEGDIGAGLAVYILKQLSGKPVNFIEPFYIDRKKNNFAAGHAGPNDYTDPRGKVMISRDVRFAKTSYKYAGAPFAWYVIPSGKMTMLHISQKDGSFQIVYSLVEAEECSHFITSYSHGLFHPLSGSPEEFFKRLLEIGVTQHYAVTAGDYSEELEDFGRIMDFPVERI